MPGASQAPNDCPADPRRSILIVPAGSPTRPCCFVTALESRPPTVRFGSEPKLPSNGTPSSIASRAASINSQSSAPASGETCACVRRSGVPIRRVRRAQEVRQVDAAVLPARDRLVGLEQVDAADEILEARDAEQRHQPTHVLGDEEEELDHVLGLAAEALRAARDPASRCRPGRC